MSMDHSLDLGRRSLLRGASLGLAGVALARIAAAEQEIAAPTASARRVVHLFMSGGPSQLDLFDPKPLLRERNGEELPDSVRQGQRLTGMTSGQKSFPCVAPMFEFERFGEHQTWVNKQLLPYTASIVDKISIVKSMYTEAVNHDPAITYINTGVQQQGKPTLGSWLR